MEIIKCTNHIFMWYVDSYQIIKHKLRTETKLVQERTLLFKIENNCKKVLLLAPNISYKDLKFYHMDVKCK